MERNELHKYVSQKSADFLKDDTLILTFFSFQQNLAANWEASSENWKASFMKHMNFLKAKNVHICTHIINRQVSGVLLQPSIAFRMSIFVDINFSSNR